ncbi:hypothetical protein JR617_000293 [Listeria monocytogenes]|nr:hypothetical protein [Listeria monocytogenes]EHD1634327.1 hypothetical protein [Listeria monocytogenes]EHD1763010.1 hypothetical protein [Listeria monocytogenes]
MIISPQWNTVVNSLDEYAEQIFSKTYEIENRFNLNVNDDGMIRISENQDIRKHALVIGESLIFPHAFLRRYGNSNFVDINCLFSKFVNSGKEVFVKLDPFKQEEKSEYQEIIERDNYYGPKFSEEVLTSKTNFVPSLHYTDLEAQDNILKLITYPVKYTIFRPSWLDVEKQIVQYYVEELIVPMENYKYQKESFPPYSGNKYVAQKFVHFTFDRKNNYFEHIDGSVRIFKRNEYFEVFSGLESTGKIYPQHIEGIDRYKLFKVKGELKREEISLLLKEFLMYNPHIKEYFED